MRREGCFDKRMALRSKECYHVHYTASYFLLV